MQEIQAMMKKDPGPINFDLGKITLTELEPVSKWYQSLLHQSLSKKRFLKLKLCKINNNLVPELYCTC